MPTDDDGALVSPNRTLGVLATGVLAFVLAQTMIIPALPTIALEYGVTSSTTVWLLTGFLLSASICAPLAGRAGDMFGRRRVLLVVLAVFAVALAGSALAGSIEVLLAARVVQGVGSAVMPLSIGIIRDEFPAERVPTAIGMVTAMLGGGSALGVVLAGAFIDYLSVAWMFGFAAVMTSAATLAGMRFLPRSKPQRAARIDWGGAVLLSVGLGAFLLAVSEGNRWGWTSPAVIALALGSVVTTVAFVRHELAAPTPLVDIRLMGRRAVWTNNVAAAGVGFALFGSLVLVPELVQLPASTGFGFGSTAGISALVMLPHSILMFLAAPLSGWLATRHGSRLPLGAGAVVATGAYLLLASSHGSLVTLAVGSGLVGISVGLAIAALGNLSVQSVDVDDTGIATGMNTVSRTVGGSIGAQVTAAVMAASASSITGLPTSQGFAWAFACSALASVLALAVVPLMGAPGR